MLVGRTLPIVERLPIVVAIRLISHPSLEIWLGGVRVVVLVVGAVIPVVPRVRLAVRGLPLVVDMDPVPILAVEGLLLVFFVVLVAPRILRGLRVAVILGAIRFTVLEVRSGVVVLPVFIPVMRSTLVGENWRNRKHHRRQQPQEHHQPSQLFFSFPKVGPYLFPTSSLSTSFPLGRHCRGNPAKLYDEPEYATLQ